MTWNDWPHILGNATSVGIVLYGLLWLYSSSSRQFVSRRARIALFLVVLGLTLFVEGFAIPIGAISVSSLAIAIRRRGRDQGSS